MAKWQQLNISSGEKQLLKAEMAAASAWRSSASA
jgi:hypothetical protein